MKINHPFHGDRKGTTLPIEVRKYVAALPPLPRKRFPQYAKAYWNGSGKGGLVPAGLYTDPQSPKTAAAVLAMHKAFPALTRHRMAIALCLQSADQLDDIRYELGIVPSRKRG